MEKHYSTLNAFYREKFGEKVIKISLDAGLTCPNKDGKKGYGGCLFCSKTPYVGDASISLIDQVENIKGLLASKIKDKIII